MVVVWTRVGAGFANRLNGSENRGVSDESKVTGLSKQKEGVTVSDM